MKGNWQNLSLFLFFSHSIMWVTKLDKNKNIDIQQYLRLGQNHDIDCRLQQRRMCYFRCVIRMDKNRLAMLALERYVHGKCGRGRPDKRFLDVIWEDCRTLGVTVHEAGRIAQSGESYTADLNVVVELNYSSSHWYLLLVTAAGLHFDIPIVHIHKPFPIFTSIICCPLRYLQQSVYRQGDHRPGKPGEFQESCGIKKMWGKDVRENQK